MPGQSKREVPGALRAVLEKDIALTNTVCHLGDKVLPPLKFKKYYKALEISSHGFLWISVNLAFVWLLWNPNYFELQVNLIFGVLMNTVLNAMLKAYVRRKRPSDDSGNFSIDQYSFPSCHGSLAVFLGYFFTFLYPLGLFSRMILYMWMVAVSVSRVLARRHYILDVAGSVVIGLLLGLIMSMFWLSESSCISVVKYLSDEPVNLEGLQDESPEL
ncbi:phospholipid phosphatase 6 [Cimex lectularius]|uniref:Phosphatidic acid phosphatase type 2/haloperoxidase domain-containing protein n=1 Tax=Cimex lectularius TaxID=79782 RepID=A0A8I6TFI6_CIMLE|nr:phospholipid phosphatase 6 [Cimex lectularius]XP_014252291.1 phospholipid phosphatase 6 [Cimex lectularius]